MNIRHSLSLMLLAAVVALGGTNMASAEEGLSPDANTLKALAEAGSDLTKPHEIDHWLYFKSEADARSAAKELASAGFEVKEIDSVPEHSEWRLLAQNTMVPRLADVEKVSAFLEDTARRHNGDYDGWETQVQE